MKLFNPSFRAPSTQDHSLTSWSAKETSLTGLASKVPVWLFFLLLLSFHAFQLKAQEAPAPDKYTEAGLAVPTVTSDKEDYSPGMTAIITGSGWILDEYVDIHLKEEPAHDHHHGYHDTKVNADGTWQIEYPIEERHLGVKFTVVVDGKQTQYQGLAYFTDAGIGNVSVGGSTFCIGGSISVSFDKIAAINNGVTGQFAAGATFIAELTDATGIQNLGQIGQIVDNQGGNGELIINGTVPSVTPGSNFKVRVRSINPVTNSPTTQSIIVNEAPSAPTASSNSSVSVGGTLNLYASTVQGATYSWTGPSGFTSSEQNPSIPNVTTAASGTYSVTATVGGCTSEAGTVNVTINTVSPTTLTVAYVTGTYGGTTTLTATLKSGSTNLSGKIVSFSLNGAPVGTATTNGSGVATLINVSIAGINASATPYANAVSASFAAETNYAASSGSASLTVGKAASVTTVSITGAPFTYNGSAITPATVSVTGAGGVVLETPAAVYANNVNAGTATASYSYAGDDNHLGSNDSETFAIGKAELTVTANDQSKYCGQDNPALTVSYSGFVVGQNASELTVQPTASTIATNKSGTGSYPITVTGGEATNYSFNYVAGNLSIKGVSLDVSNAVTPRNMNEAISVSVSVKDGNTNLVGVSVTLYINERPYESISTADGVAKFEFLANTFTANVYAVRAVAGGACSETSVVYMPVYNPDGGFVTGGGWINSPVYDDLPFMKVGGKGTFGFNAKNQNGKTTDGNTTFHLNAGNMNFKSSSHTAMSLVVSNHKATYTGEGTINGGGAYEFRVIAIDGDIIAKGNPDYFRIKIWEKGKPSAVVYDNQNGTAENVDPSGDNTILGGGAIVIHQPKSGSKSTRETSDFAEELVQPEAVQFINYPNTFSEHTTIAFVLATETAYSLEVYDLRGVLVTKVAAGTAEAGKRYVYELDGSNMASGMFVARLVTPSGVQQLRMIRR